GDSHRYTIDTVSVSNCTGTFSESAFLIGIITGSKPNSVASLTVTDCNLTSLAVLAIAENFGTIVLTNVTFTPADSGVIWTPPQANKTCAFVRPSPLYGTVPFVGASLSFNNCTIYRDSGRAVLGLSLQNDSAIQELAFNGFAVQEAGHYEPIPELIDIGAGSIGQLVLNSLNSNSISAPVARGGFADVGTVSGTGVLATGWGFPDAVMANGVPYISANSGMPSINVDGLAEPYP
ncbi:MAG: hypothetical protein WB608_09245, partial [Terracidiphilus sp.]